MLIIRNVSDLSACIDEIQKASKNIGFVPTMGALHLGHASLIQKSSKENDVTVISIFVNPRQFNNPDDLLKYPRTEEKDIALAEEYGATVVFIPEVDDIYDDDFIPPKVDLGRLEYLMEGKMRPGHFNGVIQVLYKLFSVIRPTNAYFGLKDFQQVAVVRKFIHELLLPINIVACPIYRESSGLALSSRNLRLNETQKNDALFIYHSLLKSKELSKKLNPNQVMDEMIQVYQNSPLELEYFEIVHPITLEKLSLDWVEGAVACVVAYVGEVRLIDNMQVY